jgi:phage host-nuclease inhibitor protein Gam
MARDKLITIRIEGEKREAFNQLAKAQNTDTASLLYDFINQCLSGKIDISLVTGKGQRIDNRLDTNRLDKLEIATQRLDNRIDGIETTTQRLAKRLDDWIEAIDDRVTDCDQGLSEKITSLEHRLNALSSQLDSQKDRQKIDTMEMTTQEIDNRIDDMEPLLKLQREASIATSPLPTGEPSPLPPPARPAIETAIEDTLGTGSETEIVSLSPSAKRKGLTDSELARHLGIDKSNITRWKQKGEPTQKYRDKWELRGRFWYEKN